MSGSEAAQIFLEEAADLLAQLEDTLLDLGRGLDRARIRTKAEENGLLATGSKVGAARPMVFLASTGLGHQSRGTLISG
jgi:chemotaxis protein histidine kinase CheA